MNERRFDELVRLHSPSLVTFARSLARDRWAAEEAVQDTLVRAWKYIDSFDARGSFEGWLLRICRNVMIDHAAAAARRPVSVDFEVLTCNGPASDADTTHEVTELLTLLPPQHAEVLVVVGVLGYSYEEAAELLEIPIGTVRSRLTRARSSFAELLARSESSGDAQVPFVGVA